MNTKLDITKMRVNTRNGIIKCPRCGKIGERSIFKSGMVTFTHKGDIKNIGGVKMLFVTNACHFTKAEWAKEGNK